MSDQPRDLNFYNSSMYDHKTNSPKSYDHHPSYMSFHDTLETAFIGLSPSSSEVFSDPCNLTSQNSSVSSSSAETGIEEDSTKSSKREKQEMKELEENGGEKESPKKKVLGANKGTKTKGETKKRERGQRFAFMTKSDVDQLEDGYRWRKYGQKAVKNSPYPRSYYRCTFQKCTVKKRVERSYEDPSIVITTYEGQHNHQIPTTLRGSAASAAALFSPFSSSSSMLTSSPTPPPPPAFLRQQQQSSFFPQNQQLLIQMMHPPPPPPPPSHPMNHNTNNNSYVGTTTNNTFFQLPDDYGLLQDMVPSFVHHNT